MHELTSRLSTLGFMTYLHKDIILIFQVIFFFLLYVIINKVEPSVIAYICRYNWGLGCMLKGTTAVVMSCSFSFQDMEIKEWLS